MKDDVDDERDSLSSSVKSKPFRGRATLLRLEVEVEEETCEDWACC